MSLLLLLLAVVCCPISNAQQSKELLCLSLTYCSLLFMIFHQCIVYIRLSFLVNSIGTRMYFVLMIRNQRMSITHHLLMHGGKWLCVCVVLNNEYQTMAVAHSACTSLSLSLCVIWMKSEQQKERERMRTNEDEWCERKREQCLRRHP